MWMSVQETSTNIHYDANDNVLLVTTGKKQAGFLTNNLKLTKFGDFLSIARLLGQTF